MHINLTYTWQPIFITQYSRVLTCLLCGDLAEIENLGCQSEDSYFVSVALATSSTFQRQTLD